MSTHCGIAVKHETGFNVIYCHHDGYLSYMFKTLKENYNSEELATKLVSLGDASSINKNLYPTGPHSFDNPEREVCVFYNRDRGEPWEDVCPENHSLNWIINGFFYAYVWFDGQWHAYVDGKEVIE